MWIGFNEFIFGYTLTEGILGEWRRRGILVAAPFIPTLRQEGQVGYGYDLQLPGLPIFLQFKLSEYVTRRRGKALAVMTGPYFRVELRTTRHNQHEMLWLFESLPGARFVRYVAPAFRSVETLNDYYVGARNRVPDYSVFVSPRQINIAAKNQVLPPTVPATDEPHTFVFQMHPSASAPENFHVFSEPHPMQEPSADFGSFTHEVSSALGPQGQLLPLHDALPDLVEQMMEIIQAELTRQGMRFDLDLGSFRQTRTPLEQVAYLARTFFGCEMLLAMRAST